ncbi:MAG: RNA polymerase factor sigma-54 [bacterium]
MAFELKQSMKLVQQLVMTPQLQQAIKLLQLSRMELVNLTNQELQENPVLEEGSVEEVERSQVQEEPAEKGNDRPEEVKGGADALKEINWDEYMQNYEYYPRAPHQGEEKGRGYEATLSKKTSLGDHLLWQVRLSHFSKEEKTAAEMIVGNLNEDGYLDCPLEEISQACQMDLALVEKVLSRIQDCDPIGVAARDLQECLILQARKLGVGNTIVETILREHLGNLEKKRYDQIAKRLGVGLEEVLAAVRVIVNLEPRPGRSFTGEEPLYITPDVHVYKIDDEYVVVLNEDGLPKLRISSYYKGILSGWEGTSDSTKEYIQEKLRSAAWLIKSIHQRQRTIYKVACSIVKFQREFLDKGIAYLKPLVLRDVAEDISMHESTISRVTTNKYMHTPQGILEMKYFFKSSIPQRAGDKISSETVKERIRQMIAQEDPQAPISDQEIVGLLKSSNIEIARRTVAKYRESLSILPSVKRKRFF